MEDSIFVWLALVEDVDIPDPWFAGHICLFSARSMMLQLVIHPTGMEM
jgi:hypothetical protein